MYFIFFPRIRIYWMSFSKVLSLMLLSTILYLTQIMKFYFKQIVKCSCSSSQTRSATVFFKVIFAKMLALAFSREARNRHQRQTLFSVFCMCTHSSVRLALRPVCVCVWDHDGGSLACQNTCLHASGHYCLSSQTSLLVCPENTALLPGPLSPWPAPMGPLVWDVVRILQHCWASPLIVTEPFQMPEGKHLLIVTGQICLDCETLTSDWGINAIYLYWCHLHCLCL